MPPTRLVALVVLCIFLLPLIVGSGQPVTVAASESENTPPSITGELLQTSVNGTPATVYTYQTTPQIAFTVHDPDVGQSLTLSVRVAGPIGGIIGGGTAMMYENDGNPFNRSVSFIAGAATGISWVSIEANDTQTATMRYLNFNIQTNPDTPSGAFFEVGPTSGGGQHWVALITNPEQVQIARDIIAGRTGPRIPAGRIVKGWGGFNRDPSDPGLRRWSWHLDPSSLALVEFTIELCDGQPSFVEDELDYWVNQVGTYCPWSHTILREIEIPTPSPVPSTLSPTLANTSLATLIVSARNLKKIRCRAAGRR